MSKNIYKYKIRYTNFLKKGGSNSENVNIKFKNKNNWPNNDRDWYILNNQNENISNLIWDNDIGKSFSINELEYSHLRNPYFFSLQNINAQFKIDAFENDSQILIQSRFILFNPNNEEEYTDNEEGKIGEEEEEKSIEDIDQNNTYENQQNSITNQQNNNTNQQNNNTNQQNNNTNQQNSVVQTIKFKNKSEWPEDINEIQWSSRNIDLINNIVWENDIGKDINDYTFYNSFSGFYILINGVAFRPEAFTNESRPIIDNLLRSNNIEYNYDDNVFPEGL